MRRKLIHILIMLSLLLIGPRVASGAEYQFTTIDFPGGTSTVARSI